MTLVEAIKNAREVSDRVGIASVVYRSNNGYEHRLLLRGSGVMYGCVNRFIVGADGYTYPFPKEQPATYTYEVKL